MFILYVSEIFLFLILRILILLSDGSIVKLIPGLSSFEIAGLLKRSFSPQFSLV